MSLILTALQRAPPLLDRHHPRLVRVHFLVSEIHFEMVVRLYLFMNVF